MANVPVSSVQGRGAAIGPASKQIGYVAPQPVAAAPAVASQVMASGGAVSGPYDKFRNQKPADIQQAQWDAYLDNANADTQAYLSQHPQDAARVNADFARITVADVAKAAKNTTPQQLASSQGAPIVQAAKQQQAATQQDSLVNQIVNNRTAQQQGGQQLIGNTLMPALNAQAQANGLASITDYQATQGQSNARNALQSTLGGLSTEQRANAANYNQQGTNLYNNYAQGQSALNTQDQGTLGSYLNTTNPLLTQLVAHGSNPQDISRQIGSYNQLQGVAGGSLDYQAAQAALAQAALTQAALSQYSSNPQDIANQNKSLADIQKDVASGNKDQLDALNLIKSRTGVQPTAEEALLAEQARRKFESNDKSNRDAVMEDLAQRGLRSGSAEIAGQLAGRDAYANDRSLAELGLLANATQRAQQYTGMQADQSNAMRSSQQNALGLQGNMSNSIRNANDTVGMFNTGEANQNSMFNAGQANNVSMFNAGQANDVSMFNTGQTNNARANNQATRLTGTVSAANQSNQIRNSNDAMSMFQDQYAQGEATRVGNLAGQQANIGLNTTNQIGARNDTTYGAGTNMLNTNYGRNKDSIALDTGNAITGYGADTDVNNAIRGYGSNAAGRAATYTGSSAGAVNTANNITSTNNSELIDALQLSLGANSKKLASQIYGGGF